MVRIKKTDWERVEGSSQSFSIDLSNEVIHKDVMAETSSHDK